MLKQCTRVIPALASPLFFPFEYFKHKIVTFGGKQEKYQRAKIKK